MPFSDQSIEAMEIMKSRILRQPNVRILDIGCGWGKWGRMFNGVACCDGVEIWLPYIEEFNLKAIYRNVYNEDICDFHFEPDIYDVVIFGDILEHLDYQKAIDVISRLKTLVKEIYLIIPISIYEQGEVFGNPYEAHLYQWNDKEIQDVLGFILLHKGNTAEGATIGTYVKECREAVCQSLAKHL